MNGVINLDLADLDLRTPIRITNIRGEEIKGGFKMEKIYGDFRLDLSSINKGFYFLQIGDNVSPFIYLID